MIPNLAKLHPQVVHFVVASIFVGLPLYLLAFTRKARSLRMSATILLAVGALASLVAAQSGADAHEAVEDIPGARAAVSEHEELGETTRTILIALLVVEGLSLGLARSAGADAPSGRAKAATALQALVAVGWVVGAGYLFETAEHGGELVYGYAGGVGTRSGDPADVNRLLVAGLYNESIADRAAGRSQDAARLVDEMVVRLPDDPTVRLLHVESLVNDRKDGRAALDELAKMAIAPAGAPGAGPAPVAGPGGLRGALLRSDAYVLLGLPDSARAVLMALPEARRSSPQVADRLKKIGG